MAHVGDPDTWAMGIGPPMPLLQVRAHNSVPDAGALRAHVGHTAEAKGEMPGTKASLPAGPPGPWGRGAGPRGPRGLSVWGLGLYSRSVSFAFWGGKPHVLGRGGGIKG